MIESASGLDYIRKRPEMFLDVSLKRDLAIALELLTTAMHQGLTSLTVKAAGGMRAIGSDVDWLWHDSEGVPFVFDRLVPLDGIPNSFRGEALMTALAAFYAVVEDGVVLYKSSARIADERLLEIAKSAGVFAVVIGDDECLDH